MTAPARQPQQCEHECVCEDYHIVMDEEDPKHCNIAKCVHDTRPHTSPPTLESIGYDKHSASYIRGYKDGAKAAREQVLDEAIAPLRELKGYMKAWKRCNLDLDDIEKGENIVLDMYIPFLEKAIKSLRAQQQGGVSDA